MLKKGLTLYPKNPDLLFTYAWIHLIAGDFAKVEKAIAHLPTEQKETPIWIAMMARLSVSQGRFEEALRISDQLIALGQNSFQAIGYFHKGRVLMETGDTAQAIDQFQQAQQRMKHWKDPYFYEGVCHMMDGCLEQSRKCWEKI